MTQPAANTPCPVCGKRRRPDETWIYHARARDRVFVHPACSTKPLKN